jgi:hypothetical protein
VEMRELGKEGSNMRDRERDRLEKKNETCP